MRDSVCFARPMERDAASMDLMTLLAAVAFLGVATMFAVEDYARAVEAIAPAVAQAR